MAEPATFEALIKKISTKSLVSGDKESEMILQFLPTDDILDRINKLHQADQNVFVVITGKRLGEEEK